MNTQERKLKQVEALLKAAEWYVLTLASNIRDGNVSPTHMDKPRESLLAAVKVITKDN